MRGVNSSTISVSERSNSVAVRRYTSIGSPAGSSTSSVDRPVALRATLTRAAHSGRLRQNRHAPEAPEAHELADHERAVTRTGNRRTV